MRFFMSLLTKFLKAPFYTIYEKRLSVQSKKWTKPRHVGIILDGNRRYALSLGMSDIFVGHMHGSDKLFEVLDWCREFDIPVITIWIFSLENFSRNKEEVTALLTLIERKTREYLERDDIHRNRVNVRYIGRLELLPESLREAIAEMERVTASYGNTYLKIAIAYSGREEIIDACRSFLQDRVTSDTSIDMLLEQLKPEDIEPYLYTSGNPDPDLIIRTSGEVRLSGFLLWQSAYSEYYFCDTYWPQFRKTDFLRGLHAYHSRKRRYGK